MANNEMTSKINRSNYNEHAVNLLQLNLPLDLTQYCQSIATVLFIYIHVIHMYVCMHTRMHATLSTMKSSTPLPDCFL